MGVKLNSKAKTYAMSLVRGGNVDMESEWSFSAADGNTLLGEAGDNWTRYAKYFLGVDSDMETETKAHYKYPFGKSGMIYREAVIAAKSRAAQQGETDIEEAADALLTAIDAQADSREKKAKSKDNCGVEKKGKPMMDSVSRVDMSIAMDFMQERFEKTPEGYLTGRAVVTNVGVFPYMQKDGTVRRELRLPEEVFDSMSMDSLKMMPLTNGHPAEMVNVENVKKYQVGFIGDTLYTDPYHISVPVTITDPKTIEDVQSGKRALSCGYAVDLEEKPGNWMGVEYDCIQRNIRYNHVAIVDRGRAGDAAVLKLDSIDAYGVDVHHNDKARSKEEPMLKKITLDGVEYEAEESVIKALHSSQSKLDEATKAHDQLKKDHSAAIAERDTLKDQNEQLRKDNEELKKAQPEVVKHAVDARMHLIDAARKVGVELKSDMSDSDIKKAVIVKAFPKSAEKLEKADDVYVDARFDAALEDLEAREDAAEKNRAAATDLPPAGDKGDETKTDEFNADAARERMMASQREAWKTPESK